MMECQRGFLTQCKYSFEFNVSSFFPCFLVLLLGLNYHIGVGLRGFLCGMR